MQDFTKPQLALNKVAKTQPKWLTKDRFWNFVFWFGMSSGFSSALILASITVKQNSFSYWISFLLWATIIGVPLLVRHFAKTTFLKDKIFLNSEGDIIPEKNVPDLGVIFLLTVVSVVITGLLFDKFKIQDSVGTVVISIMIFGIPSLFFICKNCPVSILFNLKYWELRSTELVKSSGNDDHHAKYTKSCRDRMNSPVYQNLPQNVHYRHR